MYCAEELEMEYRKQYMRDLNFRIEENYRKAVECDKSLSYEYEEDEWSPAKARMEEERKEKEYKQNIKEKLFNTDWDEELKRAKIIDKKIEKVLLEFRGREDYISCIGLWMRGSDDPYFEIANQIAHKYGVDLDDVIHNGYWEDTKYERVIEEKKDLERLYYSWQ